MTFEDALCLGDHELFDATDTASHLIARAICAECPAIRACAILLRQVQEETSTIRLQGGGPSGTWAGKLMGKARGAICGTESGYYAHVRYRGEVACEPCKKAHAVEVRRRKRGRVA